MDDDVETFFQIATPPTVFVWFSRSLAHVLWASQNYGTDFRCFVFKFFFGKFLKFYFWTDAAVELSGQTGLSL